MSDYKTLEVDLQKGIGIIWLNRPSLRNAFNDEMIMELDNSLDLMENDDSVRAIVIGGRGKCFCAGADLNHMKKMATFDYEQNLADSKKLAMLLLHLHMTKKPTLARVHGHAIAGGMGILTACDIALASFDAEFCLSEVRLGLIPATIGPYVNAAMGQRAAHRYMLTGERFSAAEAYRIGLVHEIAPSDKLDEKVDEVLSCLIQGGPNSLRATKQLLHSFVGKSFTENLAYDTARSIAEVRASNEGREGINSFLEKRAPAWLIKE